MKIKGKTLLPAGLVLLFLALGLACPHPGIAQSGPPVTVLITGPDYNPSRNMYQVVVGVSNPQQVRFLVVSVEDADAGTLAIQPFEINLGGFNSRQFELEGARLKPDRKYLLKVQAVDQNGNLIAQSGDNLGLGASEKYVLARKEFVHQPPVAPPFTFKIESVNADYTARTLIIRLSVPANTPILKYNGFIVDDSGQQAGVLADALYTGPEIVIPLPQAIYEAGDEQAYKITLKLYTQDAQQAEALYEVKLTPPARPTLIKRISVALAENPFIALAIILVISGVTTAIILMGRRPRADLLPLSKPHISHSNVKSQAATRGRLTVRVIESPGSARGMERRVTKFPCLIGRDQHECDIYINDPALSRKHLEISLQDGRFFLTDLSTNGTFFADQPLRKGIATSISGPVSVRLAEKTILDLEPGD